MGFITNGQRLTNHACVMTPSGGRLGRLGDAPLARALFPPPPRLFRWLLLSPILCHGQAKSKETFFLSSVSCWGKAEETPDFWPLGARAWVTWGPTPGDRRPSWGHACSWG